MSHATDHIKGPRSENRKGNTRYRQKERQIAHRVIQEMIAQSAGSSKKPAAYSLKKLAGGWTDENELEFFSERFSESISENRAKWPIFR